ncbi:hypothetical protein [Pseudoroseomonas cervicalis]|uniref:hypothetical protein n=1 Tax=Teichococcus cervicalis TaxID=204525 RepID=UPI0022F1C836|nr:hypothetical protein [Pseudoroseomonas cervicalis]WBV43084.1 hypothetical protein PFY06_00505 [Pseudoroseomonas cervicalis]
MRRLLPARPTGAFLSPALLALGLLLPGLALAQSWPNETGQGGDLMGYSGLQFDRIRAPEPVPPAAALPPPLGLPAPRAMAPATPGVQGWTPPPLPSQAQRQAAPPARARRPAQARRHPPRRSDEAATQRSLERREAEIQRLQQRLMDDRQRFESQRANTALRSAPQPASPPITR